MPAKSQAQRKFIYATKGAKFAKAHHFDNKGKLPAKAKGKVKVKKAKPKKTKSKPKGKKCGMCGKSPCTCKY